MYDFNCPYCSWGMNRDDINNQVHGDDVLGYWDVKCPTCKKQFTLTAEPCIDYSTKTQEQK